MQYEDDVAELTTGLMKKDSPLMRQAETRGKQIANKRGLLNSSMAVGAAQNEAYKAAVPLAQQKATQGFQKNMSDKGFEQQKELNQNQFENQSKLQTSQYNFQGDQAELDRNLDRDKAEWNLKANEQKGVADMSTNFQSLYQNTVANINANKDLSAEARKAQISAAKSTLNSQMNLVEQIYNVDVRW